MRKMRHSLLMLFAVAFIASWLMPAPVHATLTPLDVSVEPAGHLEIDGAVGNLANALATVLESDPLIEETFDMSNVEPYPCEGILAAVAVPAFYRLQPNKSYDAKDFDLSDTYFAETWTADGYNVALMDWKEVPTQRALSVAAVEPTSGLEIIDRVEYIA